MTLLLANNAVSTLTTGVNASATTLRVQTADQGKFPAITLVGDYFMATLEDDSGVDPVIEIVRVDARVGAVLTVQRAQEGTTGHAFPAGADIALRLTAGTMAAIVAEAVIAMQEYPGVLRVITNLADLADANGIPYLEGQYGIFTGTNTLYRFLGGSWTAALQFPQILGYISNTQMTAGMITNLLLASEAVDASKIAANAVTTAKIATSAVTSAKIGNGAVDAINLAAQAVTNAALDLAAVRSLNIDVPDIVNNILKTEVGYVGSTQITPSAVTSPKIAANTIVTTNLAAGDIVANFLAVQTGYVHTAQIVNGAITTALIQTGAITTALIQTAAITTALIDTAAVTSAKIADANITTAKIGDLQVSGEKVVGSAITNTYYSYANQGGARPNGTYNSVGVTVPSWGDGKVFIWAYLDSGVPILPLSGGSAWGSIPNGNDYTLTISRDGTDIYTSPYLFPRGMFFLDYPGAGYHTYDLKCFSAFSSDSLYDSELLCLVASK